MLNHHRDFLNLVHSIKTKIKIGHLTFMEEVTLPYCNFDM